MSKTIIKRDKKTLEVEPFSFEAFDGDYVVKQSEESLEDHEIEQEISHSVNTSNEPQMEVLKPPDLEEVVIKRLHEAEQEAQEIKSKAFEEGRAEGYQVGYAQGMEDAKEVIEQCEKVLGALNELPSKIMNDYREWLIDAAFSIAKHIIQDELSSKPQALLAIIGRLVKEMENDLPITIFLNPDDLTLLRLGIDFEEWARTQGKILKLAEDPLLERGSCRAESDIALIDATLDRIMKEMKREFLMETSTHRIDRNADG
ncbi:MAG: FliH/SctL family protein [Syntrophobacterales bacterium]|nr:FliH/SctL family protein [Syntrophobacterales bacterium]